jgi:hypothetical protein
MNSTVALNDAVEVFNRLPAGEQEEFYEMVRRGHIDRWRKATAAAGRRAVAMHKAGKLKAYTADELIQRLEKIWEKPDE